MPEETLEEWLAKAEEDFHVASLLFRQRRRVPYDTICFHCQQCAEKYLKAFLVRNGTAFKKNHDLTELQRQCSQADAAFEMLTEPLKTLYPYAVDFRYPGSFAIQQDARDAMNAVKTVRKFVRARLGLQTRTSGKVV